ncbi:DUF4840 domain-containing protein [Chryseobacterium lactis]|uniref:DUF4840 domain-containing protein n=1 Tax=Chryseobacterium lactis TaxID=1241981 RepID=A0A3G6RT74_CHRLC|nr:DUF4840 domain-containing protein [Chryseobacterium lactis]AZA81491.1 DUF4840 domain-containing protein [Chryseobacterium lactis]AZB06489.1 DUF4840 domain-containing protein [Chryseobacterium lactis]PNW15340.1 DUF4840 domain-containing protein [Chryseobacterium lactis]
MKKFTVPRFLIAALIVMTGLVLSSCLNDDRQEIPPVKLEDVKGSYKGKLIIVQGNIKKEKIQDFKVKKDTISFAEFPVEEIVKNVVKDPVKAEAALKTMGKIPYDLKYTASVNTANNVVELVFAPKTLELKIPVDGAIKNTSVVLAAKQKGFFVGMDQSLRYALVADKITVDGTALAPYEAINYNFPFCIKTN